MLFERCRVSWKAGPKLDWVGTCLGTYLAPCLGTSPRGDV